MGKVYAIAELAEEQNSFLSVYYVQQWLITNEGTKQKKLKKVSDRSCRFCRKSYPEVRFTNKAHLIPKLMGNLDLKSDFECNECNSKFSLFESDFTSFLGLHRTINPIKGNVKGFITNTLVAKEYTLSSGKKVTYLINKNRQQKVFDLNTDTGEAEATYKKPTYTPINVYKLLLKIALSCIPDSDMSQYRILIDVLNNNNNGALVQYAKQVSYYRLSVKVASPRVILFKRTSRQIKNFMHHAHIYFEDFLYIIPLPLNILDISPNWHKGATLNIFFCPPILLDEPNCGINYFRDFIDLSSSEKTSEIERLKFDMDPEKLKNVVYWDSVFDTIAPADINASPVEGIIMAEAGQTFDKKDVEELQVIFQQIRGDAPLED